MRSHINNGGLTKEMAKQSFIYCFAGSSCRELKWNELCEMNLD